MLVSVAISPMDYFAKNLCMTAGGLWDDVIELQNIIISECMQVIWSFCP